MKTTSVKIKFRRSTVEGKEARTDSHIGNIYCHDEEFHGFPRRQRHPMVLHYTDVAQGIRGEGERKRCIAESPLLYTILFLIFRKILFVLSLLLIIMIDSIFVNHLQETFRT